MLTAFFGSEAALKDPSVWKMDANNSFLVALVLLLDLSISHRLGHQRCVRKSFTLAQREVEGEEGEGERQTIK